ncbi:hypothetical protein Tsp_06752, partial [Trichinella spiralis]
MVHYLYRSPSKI